MNLTKISDKQLRQLYEYDAVRKERIRRIKLYKSQGYSDIEIAKALGGSRMTVWRNRGVQN